jgi:hypothetical protein
MKRTKQVEKLLSGLDDVKAFLEQLHEEKQEAYDNKSDKWQESEKGEAASDELYNIEEARDEAESLYDKVSELFPED